MEEVLIKIITGTLGTALSSAIIPLLNSIWEKSEEGLKEEVIQGIGTNVLRFSPSKIFNSFSIYIKNFLDILFTSNYFSWKWFKRSFIATTIFALLLHALFFFMNPDMLSGRSLLPFITNAIAYFLLFSALDFPLLWITQRTLKRLEKSNLAIALSLNILYSFIYAFFKYIVLMSIFEPRMSILDYFFKEIITIHVPDDFKNNKYGVIPGLFFYATFLYSVIFVLYFISLCLTGLAQGYDWLKDKFKVKEKPFTFLSVVLCLLLLIIVIISMVVTTFKK